MKRIYLFLALVMGIAGAATAQTRMINLESKIVKPATGSTITANSTLAVEYTFTNKGTGAIKAGDTLYFVDPFLASGYIWYQVVTADKNTNDTISVKRSQSIPATIQNGTNLQYCIDAVIAKGAANTAIQETDTSNNDACVSVNVTGGSGTSVGKVNFSQNVVKENLTIAPNPASSEIKFDFVANAATEVKARIVDVTGREVMVYNFGKAYTGQANYSLNISNLNNGIYFVELAQEGRRAMGKVVKQ